MADLLIEFVTSGLKSPAGPIAGRCNLWAGLCARSICDIDGKESSYFQLCLLEPDCRCDRFDRS